MRIIRDLTGTVYGNLTVTGYSHKDTFRKYHWFCRCSCGTIKTYRSNHLNAGRSTSCGCITGKLISNIKTTHGCAGSQGSLQEQSTYNIWASMLGRCYTSSNTAYKYYGAKGITVCNDWHDFTIFLADMGVCPKGSSIERKDVLGNYEKNNCIWLPIGKQARNRTDTIWVIMQGNRISLIEACEHLQLPFTKIRRQMYYNKEVYETTLATHNLKSTV